MLGEALGHHLALAATGDWVENGTSPELLPGPGPATKNATDTRTVNLCD